MFARRFPAEWENHEAILMAWPHEDTDWAPILAEARRCFASIVNAVARFEKVVLLVPDGKMPEGIDETARGNVVTVNYPTNDTWARDFGPVTVEEEGRRKRLDFKFNGWGLKFAADRDNLATRSLFPGILDAVDYENRLNFVVEGGSIESNGSGTVMTTSKCLLSPNRNGEWSRDQIEAYLKEALGAQHILWLDNGGISGDDTDSHIDTLARFVGRDTIVAVAPPSDTSDPDYEGLEAMGRELAQTGYNVIFLPYAGPVYDPDDGSRLPATYANFLITPAAVFVPVYGLDTDAEALDILRPLFPGREVVAVDCLTLTRQHGSLHCVTMQI